MYVENRKLFYFRVDFFGFHLEIKFHGSRLSLVKLEVLLKVLRMARGILFPIENKNIIYICTSILVFILIYVYSLSIVNFSFYHATSQTNNR